MGDKRVEEDRRKQQELLERGKEIAKIKDAEVEEIARTERRQKKKDDVKGVRQKKKKQKAEHLEEMRNREQQDKEDRAFDKMRAVLLEDSEDETEDSESEYDDEETESEHDLSVDFKRAASIGQLFLKHTGKRRRKPQDRFVKVSFDASGKPLNIS